MVKIEGVEFSITEEIISQVTSIPIIGKKFYRDRKVSRHVVVEFTKNQEEKVMLVKRGTHYLSSFIKPLWRFMLHAIIKYITLDTKFDHICTYHFMLLNHFSYGVKISFPLYLYLSMNDNINEFKDKNTRNHALHEGLLLLIYEHFKARTTSKQIKDKKEGKK